MKHATNELRLEIAQFNNFIIKNYLIPLQATVKQEPLLYLYDVFEKMGDALCNIGIAIAMQDDVLYQHIMPLNQTVYDGALSIFLIEHSKNLDDLVLRIKAVNAYSLQLNLDNITKYGLQFGNKHIIEAELNSFKQEHSDYFDQNGLLRPTPYLPDTNEILTYLKSNVHIPETRQAFSGFTTSLNVFSQAPGYKDNNATKLKILTVLNIALISLSYIEPFFSQTKQITIDFEQFITKIVTAKKTWQKSLT